MHAGDYGIWKRLPFARLLIFFFIGIMIDGSLKISLPFYCAVAVFLLITICIGEYLPLRYQWQFKQLRGSFFVLLMMIFGCLNNNVSTTKKDPAQFNIDHDSSTPLLLKINNQWKFNAKTTRYIASIFKHQHGKYIHAGKCFLYLKNVSSDQLHKGDLIISLEQPRRVMSTSNPGSFDFSVYAHKKQVTHTLYIQNDQDYIRIRDIGKDSLSIIEKIREKILQILRTTIKDTSHIGLAEAMLIGYREDLDKELLNTYVNTGVVHVIAISGMHLGLIFMLIDLGIKRIFGKNRAALAGILITIPLLWTFAILTGSSASVNRSALMFSVMILGRIISKRNTSLNALCASAFILLLYKPDLITDLGFQLSYAAVGSILLFERFINQLIYLKNKIALYVWNMISITIAAQVLTTPLVIMHFHRFPTLFLFSNLVAVPISSLILVLEIALCVFYSVNIDVSLIADVIKQLMDWMNKYIESIGNIPFNMIDDIYVSTPLMIISCLFIGSILWLIFNASKKTCWTALFFFLIMGLVRCTEAVRINSEKKVIVLNLKQITAILVQYGKNGMLAISNSSSVDAKTISSLIKETGNATGINKWEIRHLPNDPLLVSISTDKIAESRNKKAEKSILISGNPKLSLREMGLSEGNIENIIADGSNSLWKIRQWEKEAYGLHLPLHSTAENGPYTIRIR